MFSYAIKDFFDNSYASSHRRAAAKIKRMSQEVKNWKEVVVDGEQQGQVVHHEGRIPHSMSPSNKIRKKKPKRRLEFIISSSFIQGSSEIFNFLKFVRSCHVVAATVYMIGFKFQKKFTT